MISFSRTVQQVVCCSLTPLQKALYQKFVHSKAAQCDVTSNGKMALSALSSITTLKKLCNRKFNFCLGFLLARTTILGLLREILLSIVDIKKTLNKDHNIFLPTLTNYNY